MAALSRPAQDALSTIRRMFSPGGQLDAVCIPRILINLTGDLESAAILSKLIYWADKGADTEGWIYKTARDWQADIGVSYFRLAKRVKELGLYIEVKTRKVNGTPKSHYRVNLPALLSALLDSQETRKSRNSKIEKLENRETSMSEIEETRKSEIEVSQKSYMHESTTFNTSQERDKSLSPVTSVTGEVSPQEAPNTKSSKPEKNAKALSLTCGCGQTLEATKAQAQAVGWKVPTGKAALPECPTCAVAPDPVIVGVRQYLGLKADDRLSDVYVGMLANVLVSYEKSRRGLAAKQPLNRGERAELAAQIPVFITWYTKTVKGADLPRSRDAFQLWVGRWFALRDAIADVPVDTRPVSGAPLPDGYVRVSARPAQEPSPPSDEEPEHDPYEAFTRLVANRQTIPTARREQTKAGE